MKIFITSYLFNVSLMKKFLIIPNTVDPITIKCDPKYAEEDKRLLIKFFALNMISIKENHVIYEINILNSENKLI